MSQGYYSKIRKTRLQVEEQNLVMTCKGLRARAERAEPFDKDKQEELFCSFHRKHIEQNWGIK